MTEHTHKPSRFDPARCATCAARYRKGLAKPA